MIKNTYAPIPYKCACGKVTKHYVWLSDKGKVKCQCNALLTPASRVKEVKQQLTAIRTPTKNR